MQTRNKKSKEKYQKIPSKNQHLSSSPQAKHKKNNQDKQVQCSDSSIKKALRPFTFQNHFKCRKQTVLEQHKYLLEFFQINDIYHCHEVSISGIVKQYEETYALVAVKVLETLQDVLCIATIKENIQQHNEKLLKKIESDCEVMGFLDLEGKNLDELWLDNLPDQSRL